MLSVLILSKHYNIINTQLLHPTPAKILYAEVLLPLALPKRYTYYVPEDLSGTLQVGVRVEVQFGKSKLYAGLVVHLSEKLSPAQQPKPILSVIDLAPIVNKQQLQLWRWMADYYVCTEGEVMSAALPSNLKLSSETRILTSPLFDADFEDVKSKTKILLEALKHRAELSLADIQSILNQKSVYAPIKELLDLKMIYLKEDLVERYKPKKIACVRLQEPYASEPELLHTAFELVKRAARQAEALMAIVELGRSKSLIRKQDVYKIAPKTNASILNKLVEKGIVELYDKETSRLEEGLANQTEQPPLSEQQDQAIQSINVHFQSHTPVLLHGVTGSGKTRVYMELIQQAIDAGQQVLYLLPEIALTTQIVVRLKQVFGDHIISYHSRMSNNERVEVWQKVLNGHAVVLSARSGVFLPFQNLGLIVVDEEHDPSFKQNDPNPRYQGRDVAIYLAKLHGANVLLGTATPSIESYQNVQWKKYALVEMKERFGGLKLPETTILDLRAATKQQQMQSIFSNALMDELKAAIERQEQVILFQNRRGYAPILHCDTCGWHQECIHCDVSLTYHKFHDRLKCHYCGYSMNIPEACPACGVIGLSMQGYGTEKIEDELKIFLPDARIARMDLDTMRGKNALARLINNFEEQQIDILIGTQMVTKGLDFDNVSIVGIISADQLLQFPDFRASERGYQLITQVSGRAGRKKKMGKVLIQAYNTAHPVIKEVIDNDFDSFFTREITERKQFGYPPFLRLIRVTLRHKRPEILNDASKHYTHHLKSKLGDWVIGPAVPYIGRVRSYYLLDYLLKLERNPKKIKYAKKTIQEATRLLQQMKGFSGVRVKVDVDPM